jgi:hypothetical protein
MKTTLVILMATLAWLTTSQAVLFTYESFSGTSGQQLYELPQFTISGSGSDPVLGSTTLNYPDVTAGSGLSASLNGSTKTASITYNSLSSPDPNIYNNTYVSFMMNVTDVGSLSTGGSKVLWLSDAGTAVANMWIRKDGSFFNLGVSRNDSSIQWNGTQHNTVDSIFMVFAYSWEAPFGRPAGIHGWMMPTQDDLLDTYREQDDGPGGGAAFWVFDSPNSLFPDTISFAGASGASLLIDEVQVGTKWLEVAPIPEPQTILLLLMAAGGIVAFRRAPTK